MFQVDVLEELLPLLEMFNLNFEIIGYEFNFFVHLEISITLYMGVQFEFSVIELI